MLPDLKRIKRDKVYRTTIVYLAFSLCIDLMSRFMGYFQNNNQLLWLCLSLLEIIIFCYIFYTLRKKEKYHFEFIISLCAIVYIVYELFTINPIEVKTFQTYSKTISSFVIVLIAMRNIYHYVITEKEIISNQLWFRLNILIYFSMNVVLLLPINFLVNHESTSAFWIWFAYLFFTLIFYLGLIVLLWKNGKSQKQLLSGSQ